jgi:hypothetical protein
VVVLPNFIGEAQVDQWTEEYWRFMQADPADPATWAAKQPMFDLNEKFGTRHASNLDLAQGQNFRPGALDRSIPRLTDLPQVQRLAEQLGGGNTEAPFPFDGHLIARFPEHGKAWEPPAGTHLDGYGPNGWTGGYNHGFGTVAYLNDIDETHGAFTYWPQSHRSCHQFFAENPGTIDGSFRQLKAGEDRFAATKGSAWEDFWAREPHASRGGPNSRGNGVCVAGKKGDLVVWHGWLQHANSANAGTFPRLALFGSFRNAAMENSGPPVHWPYRSPPDKSELRYEIPALDDMWKFWGEDVRACGGDEEVAAMALRSGGAARL